MVKKDITGRQDLTELLLAFYARAMSDEVIGHFFTRVIPLNLEVHIPVITDFWETVLLDGNAYRKNAILPHMHINDLSPIEEKHFQRWLEIFIATVNSMFEGETAERAKQRAVSIANILRIKVLTSSKSNFLNK